jgi:hypothetical protein
MSAVSDHESQPTPKTPVEQAVEHAVDVFVYAPIGLLFEGASLLPQLIEKGKSQVTMARMLGKFAVTQGQSEAEKLAGKLQDQAIEVLGRIGGSTIDADSLAIPDYDGLSASHVVNRLAGLAPQELEAVRLYEMANRGRKTILSKVAQLQAG